MERLIYSFNENPGNRAGEFGALGNALSEMTKMGIPVPFGFNISELFHQMYNEDIVEAFDALFAEMSTYIEDLEKVAGKELGSDSNPLFLAVRAGKAHGVAKIPDAVLNVGFNDITVEAVACKTGNSLFAYRNYLRFLMNYGNFVRGIPLSSFSGGERLYTAGDLSMLKTAVSEYKKTIAESSGAEFPQDVRIQLRDSIEAVLNLKHGGNAKKYEDILNLRVPDLIPLTVQMMAFGDLNERSGSGAVYSRSPVSGAKLLFGDFAPMLQAVDCLQGHVKPGFCDVMAAVFPNAHKNLLRIMDILESCYQDMQFVEFVVEDDRLYLLHRSAGNRSAAASIRIAMDLLDEGIIDEEHAVMRVDPVKIGRILHPVFSSDELELKPFITNGIPTSAGIASGRLFYDYESAVNAKNNGDSVIFAVDECTSENLDLLFTFDGVISKSGGSTCIAALNARDMRFPLITGCAEISSGGEDGLICMGNQCLSEGDTVSMDASTGSVYLGDVKRQFPPISPHFSKLMKIADKIKKIAVMANADNSDDVKHAITMGANAIGNCRTDAMLKEKQIDDVLRRANAEENPETRRSIIMEILPMHRRQFKKIFEVSADREITISLAKSFCDSSCSMLEMQIKSVFEAAFEIFDEQAIMPEIKILISGIAFSKEFEMMRNAIDEIADNCFKESGQRILYSVGVMMESPRALLIAGELAAISDFILFDADKLTCCLFGMQDDKGYIYKKYIKSGICKFSPFVRMDTDGVGLIIRNAMREAQLEKNNIRFGLCGKLLSDPATITYCNDVGMNYVTSSPYKLFSIRLAAAQAVIRANREKT